MDRNWSVRGYKDGDEHQINNLFNSVYEKSRSMEYWNWEFKSNPNGSKMLVAVDNDKIVGHLGALHREIKIGQDRKLASIEVDGMIHPDYRRQGMFVALGKRLLSESEKEGFYILYGFPNEKALPGHRKMNCTELFTPPVMVRPVNFKNISCHMFSNRFLCFLTEKFSRFAFRMIFRVKSPKIEDNLIIKKVSEVDYRFDKFWEKACLSYPIILNRGSRNLDWRYLKCPEQHYTIFAAEKKEKVLAIVVVRTLEKFDLKHGIVMDLLALPNHENALQSVLSRAMEHLEKKKVDLVACLIPKWSTYTKVLRRCGFIKYPRRLNPKEEPFIIYPISKELNLDFVKDPKNWFITWGDTDVV